MTIIPLNKDNRMLRLGFGKHEGKWYIRIDLWTKGYRWAQAPGLQAQKDAIDQIGFTSSEEELKLVLETLDKLRHAEVNGGLFAIMVEYRKQTRIDAINTYLKGKK